MKKYLKAIIISNIFDIVASVVLTGIVTFIVLKTANLDMAAVSKNPELYQAYLSQHFLLHALLFLIGAIVSVVAGFIAAKISKERYLLMGALSSTLCFIEGIFSISRAGMMVDILLLILTPLLGILGAYLYSRNR